MKWLLFVFSFSSHKYIILARINAQVTFIQVNRHKPSELSRYRAITILR